LNFRKAFTAPPRGEFLSKLTDEVFGWSVMIGEVPGRKAGVMIGEHFFDGSLRLDVAVRAGYLPHSVEDSANGQIGGQLEPTRLW
jgi:hypothetical protein